MISVIIPTCDETVALRATLDSVAKNKPNKEVIIVGSVDGTRELAGQNSSRVLFSQRRQRAYQMNSRRPRCSWFHFAIPARRYRAACFGLRADGVSSKEQRHHRRGFARRYDSNSWFLRMTCLLASLRTRLTGWFLGDQAIFVRREVFEKLGGFRDLDLFEDLDFSRRMTQLGQAVTLSPPVVSSSRRFQHRDAVLITISDFWLTARYLMGADPSRLAKVQHAFSEKKRRNERGGNGKMPSPDKSRWKWIGLASLAIALLIAAHVLPVRQRLAEFNDWVLHLGIWGIILFIAAYIVATVLLLPASILTVGAGFVFGVFLGAVTVSIASTTGAALAYLIARYVARDQIEQKLGSNQRFKQVDRAIGELGPKLVFLLRLSPLIPFNLSNYLYGLTAVKFWPYVLASWIGMLPGTLLYVYLGAAGKAGLSGAAGQSSGRSPWEYVLFGIGLVATVIVTVWLTRIAHRELSKRELNNHES